MLLQERNVRLAKEKPRKSSTHIVPLARKRTLDSLLPNHFLWWHTRFPFLFLRKLVMSQKPGFSQAAMTHKAENVYSLALAGENVIFLLCQSWGRSLWSKIRLTLAVQPRTYVCMPLQNRDSGIIPPSTELRLDEWMENTEALCGIQQALQKHWWLLKGEIKR